MVDMRVAGMGETQAAVDEQGKSSIAGGLRINRPAGG
jgi:hypothetical protein